MLFEKILEKKIQHLISKLLKKGEHARYYQSAVNIILW